jgi:hypothetical protein
MRGGISQRHRGHETRAAQFRCRLSVSARDGRRNIAIVAQVCGDESWPVLCCDYLEISVSPRFLAIVQFAPLSWFFLRLFYARAFLSWFFSTFLGHNSLLSRFFVLASSFRGLGKSSYLFTPPLPHYPPTWRVSLPKSRSFTVDGASCSTNRLLTVASYPRLP